jgi:hypothetical protein
MIKYIVIVLHMSIKIPARVITAVVLLLIDYRYGIDNPIYLKDRNGYYIFYYENVWKMILFKNQANELNN